jgi:hypothetical protein
MSFTLTTIRCLIKHDLYIEVSFCFNNREVLLTLDITRLITELNIKPYKGRDFVFFSTVSSPPTVSNSDNNNNRKKQNNRTTGRILAVFNSLKQEEM